MDALNLLQGLEKIEEGSLTKDLRLFSDIADEYDVVSQASTIETMKPRVVNIIAVAVYSAEFDLLDISTRIRNAEYNPKRFKCVTIRLTEPKVTGLVFKNGKINIVGSKSKEDAHFAARKYGSLLHKLGYSSNRILDFKVSSMVAVINCQFPVNIEAISSAEGHRILSNYNPEVFAGLVYKLPYPQVTMLIFKSGKVVMTGAKSVEELDAAAEQIYDVLLQYKRKSLDQIVIN